MIDYLEIYHIDILIGYIGQDTEGKIIVRAKNKKYERILNAFIVPLRVETAVIEGEVSVSNSYIMLPINADWINYLEYNIPPEYYNNELKQIGLDKFEKLGFE